MDTTKLRLNVTTKNLGRGIFETTGTISVEPGDRLKRLLEIVDGIDPERVTSILRMVGGLLGIRAGDDDDKTRGDIEVDDGKPDDSGSNPERAANLV